MRHLKRFKNWLAVAYYACWAYSRQFQNQNDQPQTDLVALDGASEELEANDAAQLSEDSEVSAQQQLAALEMLDAIAGTSEEAAPVAQIETVAPAAEPKKTSKEVSPKSVEVSSAPVVASSPKTKPAPPVVSPAVKQQGTNGSESKPQQTNGKYQPGAKDDQTAQRLARLLVSEIKLYYKSKSEGEDQVEQTNIYDILKDPIEKSRKHYNQRMGKTAIETMPDYFHGELVRSLCGGDASRLGPNYPADKRA